MTRLLYAVVFPSLGAIFDLPTLQQKLSSLEEITSAPTFWDDPQKARTVLAQVTPIKKQIEAFQQIEQRVNDLSELIALAQEVDDDDTTLETIAEFKAVEELMNSFELITLLNGIHDAASSYLTIHAGAGGTEACDWASMLLRMYTRWAERKGFAVTLLESTDGDEAGIRSVTLKIDGEYAYGYLKNERGIHRLVRLSPFDSAGKRHTSFSSVDATPELEEEDAIEINEKDLRIDTYRSGGKGGQNVNKVETAVRITHLPTGVVVACQNERSQLRNKDLAMRMLMAKLVQLEEDKKSAEAERQYGEKGDIAWGNQIRSYVFQPYQMVKDLRTGVESGNIQEVMDGALTPYMEAMLRGKTRR